MIGFAICVIALALGQGEPAAAEKAAQPEAAPTSEPSSAAEATPATPVAPRPKPSAPATPLAPATATPSPAPPATPPATSSPTSTPAAAPAGAAAPVREPAAAPSPQPPRRAAAQSPAPAPGTAAGGPAPRESPAAATPPAPFPRAAEAAPVPQRAEPEREQALRAARSFLEALAASDADALAQAASDRFSFDGEPQSGREAVRRRWRAILEGRPGPPPRVNGVEVLTSQDAVARFGKPPARVAALARPGVWVAVGDVGGRPVVLFLAREAGRLAVLGIHD